MKSRHNTKTKFLIAIELFLLMSLVTSFFIVPAYDMMYLTLIILLLYHLRSLMETLTIDNTGVTINSWFTLEKRKYTFEQFDFVLKYIDPIEMIGRLDLYLLKDRVIFCRIRGRNYSNVDELISEIEKLKRQKAEADLL